jgi:GNAT superfamily N-acetyltransferase
MEDTCMTARAPLRIEEATKEDIPVILDFIRELAQYERALDRVTATEEVLRGTLFGDRPYAKAIIAYDGDEAVAFAIYFFSYSSFTGEPNLYVEDIFVRPAVRGLGRGREMFTFLARRASEHGCGRMEWSVLNWNEAAIAFYRTLGAVPVRQWTVFHLPKEKLDELAKPAP